MIVNKLIIAPMAKNMRPTPLKNPDSEVVRQALLATTKKVLGQANNIPKSILKKQAKENSIPAFVNMNSYVGNAGLKKTPVEDPRVLGGCGLNYWG